MKLIPPDSPAERSSLGGKAWALSRLEGFPVPPFVVVTPEAFARSLGPRQLELLEAGRFEALFEGLRLEPGLAKALLGALPEAGSYAVRSSAADEDAPGHSFAGQFESFLSVPREQVPEFVVKVWASGFGERSRAYREARGLPPGGKPPAVLVQAMVPAEVAGVCFSRDPLDGSRACVIAAVAGLGDKLVSGEAEGQTYRVQDGAVEMPEGALLSREGALEVAALALRCEAHFGSPQDIEWAMQGGRLYLLQSRPITTLPAAQPEAGEPTWWDNSNIIESYSGVTTPLTFSFASRAYRQVYRRLVRLFGVPQGLIEANGHVFDGMIGLVKGRVYYNLSHWYKALALLPGFSVNRGFMEQMMGVAEGMPEGLRVEVSRSRAQDALYLARTVLGLLTSYLLLPRYERAFYARLEAALDKADLSRLDFVGLARRYRRLEASLLNRWDAPLINDFFCMVFYGLLRRLGQRWLGEEGALHNDLVAGEGGMVSAEPAQRLQAMAALVRGNPGLIGRLEADPASALHEHPELGREFRAYLERFGDRCLDELKLESPTLTDQPELLARTVAQLARTPEPPLREAEARRRAAEARALGQLSGWRRRIFAYVLREARARVRGRENLRFERTRVFGEARRLFRAMGQRLREMGRLEHEGDVFYLTVEEILGYAEGTAVSLDLRGLVALRKAEFERHRAAGEPPRRFRSLGSVYEAEPVGQEAEGQAADLREGLACSPGRVRGRVRVILDPRAARLEEPAILVAPRTDPGWILVLPLARGLIVERGSLLSHSAIVARELGIPCVVGLGGATRWLRDGDEVELDGSAGTVRLLKAEVSP